MWLLRPEDGAGSGDIAKDGTAFDTAGAKPVMKPILPAAGEASF
jgi:hypothetical protein